MCLRRLTRTCLGLAVLMVASGCARTETLTPEAAKAKGDAMIKQMSQTLAGTKTFSFTSNQEIERVRRTGTKETVRFARHITVQRPNQVMFTDKGESRDGQAWYDGTQLTVVSNKDKIWARGPMPATLDEAMDYISAEYSVQVPTADLLYSNPYEALITSDTTGGWVNVENVGERPCEHLSYQQAVVDWQLWLSQDDRRLPCQLQLTYKQAPGQPVTKIAFSDWNVTPQITEATFKPVVPEGYQRIKIMRHATVEDKAVAEAEGGKK